MITKCSPEAITFVRRNRRSFFRAWKPCDLPFVSKRPEQHQPVCTDCGNETHFLVALPLLFLAAERSLNLYEINWCSNRMCPMRLEGFGSPFVQLMTASDASVDPRFQIGRRAFDFEDDRIILGSKLGGFPYGTSGDVPEYDEFLANITYYEISKAVFPADSDLSIFRHDGQLGYCLMR